MKSTVEFGKAVSRELSNEYNRWVSMYGKAEADRLSKLNLGDINALPTDLQNLIKSDTITFDDE